MKQYTTPEQTAKLIELGFESSTRIPFEVGNDELGCTFSIGGLIEMLPEALAPLSDPDNEMMLNVSTDPIMWTVRYGEGEFTPYETISFELIDALYDMVVKLKEEEAI